MSPARHFRLSLAGLAASLIVLGSQTCGIAIAGAAPQDRHPPGWRELESKPGRFKALLPSEPKTSRQNIKTDIGNVIAVRFTASDAANVTYDILFNDYPKDGVIKANPQKLLDSARDGLLYQTKGKLLEEKRIMLGKLPGRDQQIAGGDGTHYRVRLIWAENRLYQIMAVSPGQPRPDAQVFFDGFQLLGNR